MNTIQDKPNQRKSIFRKLAFLADEAVLHLALVGVVVAAVVEGALSLGGGAVWRAAPSGSAATRARRSTRRAQT